MEENRGRKNSLGSRFQSTQSMARQYHYLYVYEKVETSWWQKGVGERLLTSQKPGSKTERKEARKGERGVVNGRG